MSANIYGLTRAQLAAYLEQIGETRAKSSIIYNWLYRQRINSFSDISNINGSLISQLSTDFFIKLLPIITKQENEQVCKYLFQLEDGNCIEAVLMKHGYGYALCISTQVGCNMGCLFCESGRQKKIRNLNAAELTMQLLSVEQDCGSEISKIVVMGIGEPFDNYYNLIDFIDIITDVKGLNKGPRHITVSTCGLIPGIDRFSQRMHPNNLAVSLHAPTDEIRKQLMPIAQAYTISPLLASLKNYQQKTRQKITIEYLLLAGINDHVTQAEQLAQLLCELNCTVNLIPYNETNNTGFRRSSRQQTLLFYDRLKKLGIHVTLRKELGSGIQAACGQLRASTIKEKHDTSG